MDPIRITASNLAGILPLAHSPSELFERAAAKRDPTIDRRYRSNGDRVSSRE